MTAGAGFTTLVDAPTLAAHLDDADWLVVDCRHDLADSTAGRRAYANGHAPGAHFLHLDDDLSGPRNGHNGRHPLPDAETLAQRLGELGIDATIQVVAYDDAGGMFAARLWWLLRWLGHTRVAVLDGGLTAWRAAGLPLDTAVPTPSPRHFSPRHQADMTIAVEDVMQHLDSGRQQLIDARSPDRFRGENETLDPVGGHIPGALNHFFRNNLAPDGRFLPAASLRQQFEALLAPHAGKRIVHQCGSGVTACHNILAMTHAGLEAGRLYPGSWSEWCADPARPVAAGA